MAEKFEVYTDAKGEFRFRLKAANGQTILTGEGYKARESCDNGIESVRKNSADPSRFERKESANGKHFFVLKAANHQVIGQSQMYASADAMETGISSVTNCGSTQNCDDMTG